MTDMKQTSLTIGGVIAAITIFGSLYSVYSSQQKDARIRAADQAAITARTVSEDRVTESIKNRLNQIESKQAAAATERYNTTETMANALADLESRIEADEVIDSNHRLTTFPDAVKGLESRMTANERTIRSNEEGMERNTLSIEINTAAQVAQKSRAEFREGERKVRIKDIGNNQYRHEQNSVAIAKINDKIKEIDLNKVDTDHTAADVAGLIEWRDSLQISSVKILEGDIAALQAELEALRTSLRIDGSVP